jgi:ABC-type multidrug transport system fused ATPase/permease subunit
LQPLQSSVRLENVSFSYTGELRNLDDVSLEIPRGARVAFVGASGCGKSTCLNLILRFFDPDEGRVCYDNTDLRDASLDSLAARMGVVFQDNVLFNTSVRENVRMGRAGATDEEVEAACRLAELHSVILAMPQGYDSPVGENGSRLSVGSATSGHPAGSPNPAWTGRPCLDPPPSRRSTPSIALQAAATISARLVTGQLRVRFPWEGRLMETVTS